MKNNKLKRRSKIQFKIKNYFIGFIRFAPAYHIGKNVFIFKLDPKKEFIKEIKIKK